VPTKHVTACKSVAKATQVRILDPPRERWTASDLRKRGQGPFPSGPAESGFLPPFTAVCGRIVGGWILVPGWARRPQAPVRGGERLRSAVLRWARLATVGGWPLSWPTTVVGRRLARSSGIP
jgi:hypothetical protein